MDFTLPELGENIESIQVAKVLVKAGDSVDTLSEDYGCASLDIEEALRCELQLRTAA